MIRIAVAGWASAVSTPDPAAGKALPRARMTLRVSRDSGRTFGPRVVVEPTVLPDDPSGCLVFPPCTCPQHAHRGDVR